MPRGGVKGNKGNKKGGLKGNKGNKRGHGVHGNKEAAVAARREEETRRQVHFNFRAHPDINCYCSIIYTFFQAGVRCN